MLATLSATSAILLVAVTLLSTYGYIQLRRAYNRVDAALDDAHSSEANAITAKKQAEKQRDRTRAEYERAEANLAVALRAFDEISDRLAAQELPQSVRLRAADQTSARLSSGLSAEDVDIVESLLKFYDEFAANNASRGVVDFATAKVHRRIGDICSRLGDYDRAVAAYRQALRDSEEFDAAKVPTEEKLFRVQTLNALGKAWLSSGDFRRAQESHQQALDWLQRGKPNSLDGSQRFELALTLTDLVLARSAEFMHQQSRRGPRRPKQEPDIVAPPAIHDEFQQALDMLNRLVESEPENADYRLALARCHRSILPVAWAHGDDVWAGSSKQQAIKILRQLVRESSHAKTSQFELADTLAMTPYADSRTPISEADVAALTESISISSGLHDQFPTAPEFAILLATTHQKLGSHFMAKRAWNDAETHLSETAGILDRLVGSAPQNPLYQVTLARVRWELAESLRRQNSDRAARELLEQAVRDYRSFRETKAGQRSSIGLLVGLYRQLARTLEQLGEDKLAAQMSSRADQLRQPRD